VSRAAKKFQLSSNKTKAITSVKNAKQNAATEAQRPESKEEQLKETINKKAEDRV
jgi:hypothetical protein